MANFQIAELQAKAQRLARDLTRRSAYSSPDELDAIEEQEAEVRYHFRCIQKVMRWNRVRRGCRRGAGYKTVDRLSWPAMAATGSEEPIKEGPAIQ